MAVGAGLVVSLTWLAEIQNQIREGAGGVLILRETVRVLTFRSSSWELWWSGGGHWGDDQAEEDWEVERSHHCVLWPGLPPQHHPQSGRYYYISVETSLHVTGVSSLAAPLSSGVSSQLFPVRESGRYSQTPALGHWLPRTPVYCLSLSPQSSLCLSWLVDHTNIIANINK